MPQNLPDFFPNSLLDPKPDVKTATLTSLALLARSRSSIDHQVLSSSVRSISQLLQDSNVNVRATAAWTLGEYGRLAAPAATALVSALGDSSESVRDRASEGIPRLGVPEHTVPLLIRAVEEQP